MATDKRSMKEIYNEMVREHRELVEALAEALDALYTMGALWDPRVDNDLNKWATICDREREKLDIWAQEREKLDTMADG